MKKTVLMAVAALMATMTVSAQSEYYDTKHEVELSVGTLSNSQIVSAFESIGSSLAEVLVTSMTTAGQVVAYEDHANEKEIPSINAGYYYHVSKLIAVGGFLSFNGSKYDVMGKIKVGDGEWKKDQIGTSNRYHISLIPSAKFHWARTKHFGFYSKAGVGATMIRETMKNIDKSKDVDETRWMFNWNAIPVGLDVGSEFVRGFLEIGVGEQGIFAAGLRYKF